MAKKFRVRARRDILPYVTHKCGYHFIPQMYHDGEEFEVYEYGVSYTNGTKLYGCDTDVCVYHSDWLIFIKSEDDLFDF